MSNIANIALTALQALEKKSEVIADNIANVNTDRFKKSRANLEEGSPSGVKVSMEQVNTSIETVTAEAAEPVPSNVDLAEELIDLIVTRSSYTANTKTVKAADQMQGFLFDILG